MPVGGIGRDPRLAARAVVADGVVEQVVGQALQEDRLAVGSRRPHVGLHGEAASLGFGPDAVDGAGHDVGQVDRTAVGGPRLAAGQGEEPVERALTPVDRRPDVGGHGQQLGPGRLAVEGDVEGGAHGGQRGAQLVRGVGGEQALAVEHLVAFGDAALDAIEHPVDRAGQPGEVVGRGVDRHPLGGREPAPSGGSIVRDMRRMNPSVPSMTCSGLVQLRRASQKPSILM